MTFQGDNVGSVEVDVTRHIESELACSDSVAIAVGVEYVNETFVCRLH